MESEVRYPSPLSSLPLEPDSSSISIRDRILDETAAKYATNRFSDVNAVSSQDLGPQDKILEATAAPSLDQILEETAAQSVAEPSPDVSVDSSQDRGLEDQKLDVAASESVADQSPDGLQETTAQSDDISQLDADAQSVTGSSHVLQGPSVADILSDDLRDRILTQVEYYFSDANLRTDKYLLNFVKKGNGGFVPIEVIASFKRMKKLVQNPSQIVAALRTSPQLVVSLDGKNVKRLHPLLDTEIKDGKLRTIIVENLPEVPSKDYIQGIFGTIGNILNIATCDPHSTHESELTSRKARMSISNKLHALVEYETNEAAARAVDTLNDKNNWRTGLRVELLARRMKKLGIFPKERKSRAVEKKAMQASDMAADGQKMKSVSVHDAKMIETKEERSVDDKGCGRKSQSKGRGKGILQQQTAIGHGTGSSDSASKPIPGPKMPDGTKGFSAGRGKRPL